MPCLLTASRSLVTFGTSLLMAYAGCDSVKSPSTETECKSLGTATGGQSHESSFQLLSASPEDFGLNDAEVVITEVSDEDCEFTFQSLDRAQRTMPCSVRIETGLVENAAYRLTTCATEPGVMLQSFGFLVLRDMEGKLVVAGGAGTELVDSIQCLPLGLDVSKVEGCSAFDVAWDCGPRTNFGLRFTHDETEILLFPGESGILDMDGSKYEVFNHYSYYLDGSRRCSDSNGELTSWTIVRR